MRIQGFWGVVDLFYLFYSPLCFLSFSPDFTLFIVLQLHRGRFNACASGSVGEGVAFSVGWVGEYGRNQP